MAAGDGAVGCSGRGGDGAYGSVAVGRPGEGRMGGFGVGGGRSVVVAGWGGRHLSTTNRGVSMYVLREWQDGGRRWFKGAQVFKPPPTP